ncbi:hypothetical protein F8M41_018246 [Gigaspora margarita]|uniref:Uncharacterized protein n=1 Tax=Gigaspora margarita TaxID=4874 RepID=A0A8H4ELK5_GIGMA|nr:hypothetical protein F8M41_018246 [Gigaspora margarita]
MLLTSNSNFSNNTLGQFNPNRIATLSPFNEMSIYQASADGLQFMSPNSTMLTMASNQNNKGIEWLQIAKRHFGDFCNKLVNDIENLDLFSLQLSSPLQKEEIIAFMNEAKMLDVLNQWLNTTNMDELRAHDSKIIYLLQKLCDSVTPRFITFVQWQEKINLTIVNKSLSMEPVVIVYHYIRQASHQNHPRC